MSENTLKPWDLKAAYDQGRNIMQMVRENAQEQTNDERTIELSYDLQSGSYVRYADTPEGGAQRRAYTKRLAEVLAPLGPISSLLEAGVGEATTLWHLLDQLPEKPQHAHGFDLCWSRVGCGANWLAKQTPRFDVQLAAASLLEMPYADGSFDVVYTAHAIEPNHGREAAILVELHRVANRHVVLLEPAYEFASPEARARMDSHGYCRALAETARSLGFNVTRHELFDGHSTPLNPTALTVITKNANAAPAVPAYQCPSFRTPMKRLGDCFYSEQSMRAYPVIGGIPCLRTNAGIIASKLGDLAAPH